MKAGRLRSRVMLQEPTESRDSYGAIVKGWRDLKEVAANIRYQTGAEYQRHHADLGEAGVSVRIRYSQYALFLIRRWLALPYHLYCLRLAALYEK